jgi:hypothetical protein
LQASRHLILKKECPLRRRIFWKSISAQCATTTKGGGIPVWTSLQNIFNKAVPQKKGTTLVQYDRAPVNGPGGVVRSLRICGTKEGGGKRKKQYKKRGRRRQRSRGDIFHIIPSLFP